jgi:hypothetical protein
MLTCLLAVALVNAQSLEEIVKNYTVANKLDKVSGLKTIKLSGNMSMMGMELPIEIWMKNPDKVKSVTNINGQEIVQVYDGVKGYMVNPMSGSAEPVEMSPEDTKQILRSNMFQNYMESYLKGGQLALEGEEAVNGNPAHKIKATLDGGLVMHLFIDKSSNLLVKSSVTVNNQGTDMVVDSYPSEYTETNGLLLPMKTTTSASGMDFEMKYTKVEVDLPMDDSVFKVK